MTINRSKLAAALADPAIAGLSDADAATALSVPILTPRVGPITLTTLAGADAWGFAKASAFHTALQAAAATNSDAATLLAILSDGLLVSDPQVASLAPTFVALSGGAITTADIPAALNTTSYRCDAPIQASDVTAARARIAAASEQTALRVQWAAHCSVGIAAIDTAVRAGTALPTLDQLRAL